MCILALKVNLLKNQFGYIRGNVAFQSRQKYLIALQIEVSNANQYQKVIFEKSYFETIR